MSHKFIFSVNLFLNGVFNATLSLIAIDNGSVTKYVVTYTVDVPVTINRHKTFVNKKSAYKYFNAYLSKFNKSLL